MPASSCFARRLRLASTFSTFRPLTAFRDAWIAVARPPSRRRRLPPRRPRAPALGPGLGPGRAGRGESSERAKATTDSDTTSPRRRDDVEARGGVELIRVRGRRRAPTSVAPQREASTVASGAARGRAPRSARRAPEHLNQHTPRKPGHTRQPIWSSGDGPALGLGDRRVPRGARRGMLGAAEHEGRAAGRERRLRARRRDRRRRSRRRPRARTERRRLGAHGHSGSQSDC